MFLKHLMRGVSLGLFDETTAMEKFEKWNGEHEELVAKREETHRKHKSDKRHETMKESVRKIEEKNSARAAQIAEAEADAAGDAETETTTETATENQEG